MGSTSELIIQSCIRTQVHFTSYLPYTATLLPLFYCFFVRLAAGTAFGFVVGFLPGRPTSSLSASSSNAAFCSRICMSQTVKKHKGPWNCEKKYAPELNSVGP